VVAAPHPSLVPFSVQKLVIAVRNQTGHILELDRRGRPHIRVAHYLERRPVNSAVVHKTLMLFNRCRGVERLQRRTLAELERVDVLRTQLLAHPLCCRQAAALLVVAARVNSRVVGQNIIDHDRLVVLAVVAAAVQHRPQAVQLACVQGNVGSADQVHLTRVQVGVVAGAVDVVAGGDGYVRQDDLFLFDLAPAQVPGPAAVAQQAADGDELEEDEADHAPDDELGGQAEGVGGCGDGRRRGRDGLDGA